MSSLLSYVWLSLKRGLGNYLRAEVLRRMGSPEAVYAADSTMLAQSCPSLRRQHIELLCDKSTDEAEQVITQCAREDIRILPVSDAAYPDRLRQIEDPPVVLYIRGRWPDFDTMPGIAVVGTRQATSYGVQVAGTIGAELAKAGFVTVSGMALGNDAAAHRGALRAGGLTVAVLAGGPDVCYPPQNRALMGDILLSGAVISEYPPGTEPDGLNYKSRNRIISGLCVATAIVEAGSARSGALITARHALDQSRDVYAVPGAMGAPQSRECNALIERCEAALLNDPRALVREYASLLPGGAAAFHAYTRPPVARTVPKQRTAPERRTPEKPAPVPETAAPAPEKPAFAMPEGLDENEQKIVRLVAEGMHSLEELVECCGLPAPRLMCMVTTLEMEGVLERDAANVRLARQE